MLTLLMSVVERTICCSGIAMVLTMAINCHDGKSLGNMSYSAGVPNVGKSDKS